MRRFAPLLAIVAVAAAFSGCGGDTAASEPAAADSKTSTPKVEIKAFQFMPDELRVKAGQEIEWTNADATVHTIVGGTRKQPDTSVLDGETAQGESYSATISEPGTYKYFCDRHSGPGMTSTVVVE